MARPSLKRAWRVTLTRPRAAAARPPGRDAGRTIAAARPALVAYLADIEQLRARRRRRCRAQNRPPSADGRTAHGDLLARAGAGRRRPDRLAIRGRRLRPRRTTQSSGDDAARRKSTCDLGGTQDARAWADRVDGYDLSAPRICRSSATTRAGAAGGGDARGPDQGKSPWPRPSTPPSSRSRSPSRRRRRQRHHHLQPEPGPRRRLQLAARLQPGHARATASAPRDAIELDEPVDDFPYPSWTITPRTATLYDLCNNDRSPSTTR